MQSVHVYIASLPTHNRVDPTQINAACNKSQKIIMFLSNARNLSPEINPRKYFYEIWKWQWFQIINHDRLIRLNDMIKSSIWVDDEIQIKEVNFVPNRPVQPKFLFPANKPVQVTPCFVPLCIPSCFGLFRLFREVPVILAEILISVRNQFRKKLPLWNWFLPVETHRSVTLIQWRSSGEAHHCVMSLFC